MLATIVDWAALGRVVVYSFAAALVLTTAFTTGGLLVDRDAGQRASAANRLLGAAAFALCLGLLAVGLCVMLTTK